MLPDLARIAFVSRRFNELKGLSTVLMGAALLSALLPFSFLGGQATSAPGAWLIVIISASNVLDLKYRTAFGNPVSESPSDVLSYLMTSLPVAMMAGALWDRLATIARIAGPSGAAVAVGCASLAVLMRDVRWRPHYAVPLAAAVFGVIITATTEPAHPLRSWERDPQRAPVFFVAYTAMAFGMVVAGLFDHWLLTSILAKRTPTRPANRPHRRSSRSLRIALFASVSFGLAAVLPEDYAAIALCAPFLVGMWLTMTLAVPRPVPTAMLGLHSRPDSPDSDVPDLDAALPSVRTLMAVLVLTAAAAADIVRPASQPMFLPIAFGGCALWIAVTAPQCRHYLVGVAASTTALIVGSRLPPLSALTVFLSAAAAAIALVLFIDGRHAVRAGGPDADTI